jgi:hypothetical protein
MIQSLCNDGYFPIKLQIPLVYSILAHITFNKFQYLSFPSAEGKSDFMKTFDIPKHFTKISRNEGMKMLTNRSKVLVFANISA